MKRTTIMLPERMRAMAFVRARALGISFGEFVRRSVAFMLESEPEKDPLGDDVTVYEGPVPDDLAKNHDRYLYGPET